MPGGHKSLRSSFTFGTLMAESDPLLSAAYWDNGDFETIESRFDPRCFIVGRTGSGKSAALRHLEEVHPGRVVRIVPENLSLPYLTNLGVVRQALRMNVHLEPFLKALWKHIFIVELLRHRYDISSPEKKTNALQQIKEWFRRDHAKIKAIEYLDEFGDKFWCEADERVKQIAETFERKVIASGGLAAGIGASKVNASGGVEDTVTQDVQWETAARYQRIVNESQLPRLNEMVNVLDQYSLDEQHFTYLIIDDLDKEWEDEELANLLIRCLFYAVVDMSHVRNLKILVALRTNIFHQLNYGSQPRGSQEEKFRGLALHLGWTAGDLRNVLQQRASAACALYGLEPARTLEELLPKVHRRADPVSHILARTLMRPRDAILYLNACVRGAAGKDRITWQDIFAAEKDYSHERFLALRDEWKDPYFDIDKVLERFRRQPHRLNRAQVTAVLDEIVMLLADPTFRGATWLTALCEQIWAPDSWSGDWFTWYGPLIQLLYMISFIGIAKGHDRQATYSYERPDRVRRSTDLPETVFFEIHPAFRQELETDYVTLP